MVVVDGGVVGFGGFVGGPSGGSPGGLSNGSSLPSPHPGSSPSISPSPSLSIESLQFCGGGGGGDAVGLGDGAGEGSGDSELSILEEQPGSAVSTRPSRSSSRPLSHWRRVGDGVGEGSGSGSGEGNGLGEEKGNSSGIEVLAGSSDPVVEGSSSPEGSSRKATTNGVRPMRVRPETLRILEGVHRTRRAAFLAGSSLDYRSGRPAGGLLEIDQSKNPLVEVRRSRGHPEQFVAASLPVTEGYARRPHLESLRESTAGCLGGGPIDGGGLNLDDESLPERARV